MKKSTKPKDKKPPTSKSRKVLGSIVMATVTEQVYQVALKSIISSLVQHCSREILIEISKYINTIYPKLEDLCLNSIMENDTVKRRELVWNNVTSKILDVLHPLILYTNTELKPLLVLPSEENPKSSNDTMNDVVVNNSENYQETTPSHILNHAIKAYAQCRSAEKKSDIIPIYWPKPLEINFLQIKDADDVATIYCKVGGVTIPYAIIDSGSDSSIISENVAKHLGLNIDRKKIHR